MRSESRKKRNVKTIILAVLIIALVVAAIVFIVLGNKKETKEDDDKKNDNSKVENTVDNQLPDTVYKTSNDKNMEVTQIVLDYLEENNETMVSMVITNTTDEAVEDEWLDAILISSEGKAIGSSPTYISNLAVGEECNSSVVLKGDLRDTKSIRLQQQQKTNTPEEVKEPEEVEEDED